MGESLYGKLRDMLSRENKSGIAGRTNGPVSSANLARIGLAAERAPDPVMPDGTASDAEPSTGAVHPDPATLDAAPVGMQFFAEVPFRQSADEIVTVSRSAHNCSAAEAQPVGDDVWAVSVTLSMAAVAQDIQEVETVFQTWAEKLGGTSKGCGLTQNRFA